MPKSELETQKVFINNKLIKKSEEKIKVPICQNNNSLIKSESFVIDDLEMII